MEARTGSHDKKYPERETRRGSSDLKLASAGRGGEGARERPARLDGL
jgi:hypothetical protein